MKPDRLTIVISILGVILTTASVIASVAQYRAADLQAQAAMIALMPQIEVRDLLEKVDSDKFTDRRLEVTSDGGPVYNFRIDRHTWIEFRMNRKLVYEQPLVGYYFAEFPTGRSKGAVDTIKGYKNNERFIVFQDWARSALGSDVEISQPITLLRISYRDAFKRNDAEFVQVDGGTEVHLSEEVGLRLWQHCLENEKSHRAVDIDDLASAQKAGDWLSNWTAMIRAARQ